MARTDSELIDALGGTSAVARLFDIKPPSVSNWRTVGIPKARLMYLRLSRPDLFDETTWAEKIEALEDHGFSLVEIADEVGLTTASISEIKQGRTKAPTGMAAVHLYQMYERICVAPALAANDDNYQESTDAAG